MRIGINAMCTGTTVPERHAIKAMRNISIIFLSFTMAAILLHATVATPVLFIATANVPSKK